MPSQIHGNVFQDEFQTMWLALGKLACASRFTDASDLYGLNKKLVMDFPKPADFLITYNGWTALCECKATKDMKGFPVGNVRRGQMIAATRMVAAKGNYVFAVKRMHDGVVFTIPASIILNGRGTLLWSDLVPYQWLERLPRCLTM